MDTKDDFLKQLNDIFSEAESETAKLTDKSEKSKDGTDGKNIGVAEKRGGKKNVHEGHRKRVRSSVDTDPDFATFSDHEILEYLLFATIPRVDTNEIAHELIDNFGSFSGVLNATVNELVKIPYINESTARMITAIIPAARRAEISRLRNNVYLDTAKKAVEYIHPFFMNRNREYVYLVSLDISDRVICVNLIASGDVNFSSFDIKKVIEAACRNSAAKVILAHNHPAGSLVPSEADVEVTQKLGVALTAMGIMLVDHLIFTANDYFSFYASGKIEEIYATCDSMLRTPLVKELRSRKQNKPDGKYIFEKGSILFEKNPEKGN